MQEVYQAYFLCLSYFCCLILLWCRCHANCSDLPPCSTPQSPSPTRPLDLPAELLPLDQKAESGAKVDKDTTGQHKSHLFDLHCKICTGELWISLYRSFLNVLYTGMDKSSRSSTRGSCCYGFRLNCVPYKIDQHNRQTFRLFPK